MGTLFRNATLVQLDPPRVVVGDLRQESGRIVAVGGAPGRVQFVAGFIATAFAV